jgi:hypothetical protein
MITLSGQRFVGVSQADETLSGTFKRLNHAIKLTQDSRMPPLSVTLDFRK